VGRSLRCGPLVTQVRQDWVMKLSRASSFFGLATILVAVVVSGCSDDRSATTLDTSGVGSDVDVTVSSSTTSVPPDEPPVFDFDAPDSATGWSVVNDTVMGGVSSGRLIVENGSLIFSGELSLDNNGGFASVRGPAIEPRSSQAWSGRPGPRIVAEGDGRTWTVEVRTDDPSGGWIASLLTSTDSITEVTLPWTSFEPVSRFLDPREVDEPLDPRRILSIAFYLVDGIEGPFRLGISSIS
jgi:hypothetical protein